MKKEKYRIHILGTLYKIYFRNDLEDTFLREADGYMDKSAKIIVIGEKPYDSELVDFPAAMRISRMVFLKCMLIGLRFNLLRFMKYSSSLIYYEKT